MTSMPTPAELGERLRRTAASCHDMDALARALFAAITSAVPVDFTCLATTDPASGLITKAIKSHPLPLGDEEFAASEYGAPDVNQFAEIARRDVPVGVLSVDTAGHPDRCARLRDYMTPQFGFTDEIRVVCRSRNAVWAAFAVYRRGGRPFTAADGVLLAGLVEPVAAAVQRVLFHGSPAPGAAAGPAVLIVDADNRLTDVTAAAEVRIADLGGRDQGALPANVLAVVATARSTLQPTRTVVPSESGRWTTLQALPLGGSTENGASVVVTIDDAASSTVGRLTLSARGLTDREQDVSHLVLQGASTKDIAATLHLSPHTVQDHLKAIFVKLGVSSRREMIGRLVAGT